MKLTPNDGEDHPRGAPRDATPAEKLESAEPGPDSYPASPLKEETDKKQKSRWPEKIEHMLRKLLARFGRG